MPKKRFALTGDERQLLALYRAVSPDSQQAAGYLLYRAWTNPADQPKRPNFEGELTPSGLLTGLSTSYLFRFSEGGAK